MRRILLLASLLFVFQFYLWAYDFEVGGIYYNISGSEVSVTYEKIFSPSYLGSITIPETVSYNSVTYSVTSIGEYSFYNCAELTEVTIGDNISSVGTSAFEGCTELTKITIPRNVTTIKSSAFSDCTGLTNLIIEEGEKALTLSGRSTSTKPFTNCPFESLYLGRNLSYNSSYSHSIA